VTEQTQRVPIERFQILAGLALVVLALAWFVPDTRPRFALGWLRTLRPRPGLALLLVALVVGGACAGDDPVRSANKDANRLYQAAQFEEALQQYERLLAERPDLPELAYNAGNTLNRLGRFDRAVEETRRALPPTTTKLGATTYYALGNHYLAQGDLKNALDAYKSALLLDPDDADARWNLEIILLAVNLRENPGNQPAAGDQPGDQPPPGQPGEQPGPPGPTDAGQPGQPPTTDQPPAPSSADVQRALQEALAGIDQEFTFEDALEVLDLLQQLRETQQQQPGRGSSPGGLDY